MMLSLICVDYFDPLNTLHKPLRFEGTYVCQFWDLRDVCQQRAKYALSIDNLYRKYTIRGNVCQFWGTPTNDKATFLRK